MVRMRLGESTIVILVMEGLNTVGGQISCGPEREVSRTIFRRDMFLYLVKD